MAIAVREERPAILRDRFDRVIDHLRLSVTSACDLRCSYCRPSSLNAETRPGLTDRQRVEFVTHFHERYRLSRLRLTGGEPLLHPTLARLIRSIRRACPRLDIAMTTNGRRLAEKAEDLREAGLDRLNVSLDTLDAGTYRTLTGGNLAPVLDGIRRCKEVGFPPPRINAVVLRGVNDDHLPDLVEWACGQGSEMRFLEAMPVGPAADFNRTRFVAASEMLQRLAGRFELSPLARGLGETARRYSIRGGSMSGVVGIISPVSQRFCGQCRRVRVTADGRLFPCLLDGRNVDLRPVWRDGAMSHDELDCLVRAAVEEKQAVGPSLQHTAMVQLGG